MRVQAFSRSRASSHWFTPDVALISIREREAGRPLIHGNPAAILDLEFDDCDPGFAAHLYDDDTGLPLVPMSESQAREVAAFVERHADKSFVVHCLAGVSRSVGCASAIAKHIGEDWEAVERGKTPNAHVRRLVTEALQAKDSPHA